MHNIVIIGGGIVGLSTAWQLQQRHPDKSILLLEKEDGVARHQSGHNSGVIHSGIYYEPGSLKVRTCREGAEATVRFCEENGIIFEQCGKLLVATSEPEQRRMMDLFERARVNGIEVELLDDAELKRREPHVRGLGAILVRTTGIVDYREVCEKMAQRFREAGGEIRFGAKVSALAEAGDAVTVTLEGGEQLRAAVLVACTGLAADRTAAMMGLDAGFRIIPFRGEYYRLAEEHNSIVRHLIYPIPDPELPFLGVHLTRMIDGTVTVGPNAVQGWKREGYGKLNFSLRDSLETLSWPGYWKLAGANFGRGVVEMRNSLWKRGYLKEVQKYCPEIGLEDLEPYPAGIRAQAVLRDGTMLHDFLFSETARSLHVCNAPSPAATSAIPIGRHICAQIERLWD